MKFAGKLMDLEKSLCGRQHRHRKTNVIYVLLFIDVIFEKFQWLSFIWNIHRGQKITKEL